MRHSPLSLRKVVIAAIACGAFACGLDTTGLGEIPRPDASSSSTHAPITDASVSTTPADGGALVTYEAGFEDADPSDPDVHVLDPDAANDPGEAGDPCDLDEDGFRSASEGCGGTDCCDFDGRAYPGEPKFFDSADACGTFDYDCDGKTDGQYPVVGCKYGVPCTGSGFDKTPPSCGDSATFDTCNFAVVFCAQAQSTVTQGCK